VWMEDLSSETLMKHPLLQVRAPSLAEDVRSRRPCLVSSSPPAEGLPNAWAGRCTCASTGADAFHLLSLWRHDGEAGLKGEGRPSFERTQP
jgi:hypothetical protein